MKYITTFIETFAAVVTEIGIISLIALVAVLILGITVDGEFFIRLFGAVAFFFGCLAGIEKVMKLK